MNPEGSYVMRLLTRTAVVVVMVGALLVAWTHLACAMAPVQEIRTAGITGGLIAQVGSDDLALSELGERFHVRLLWLDDAAVEKSQAALGEAGLQGRFTVGLYDAERLPFADRVLNALVLAKDGLVPETEAQRVLVPRGLLISPAGVKVAPAPRSIDQWTHYLYDASGNAVSKDSEVAPPKSFRWWAPPRHLRSHNHGSSFTGLVTAQGRLFYFQDEGPWLFDKEQGGIRERWSVVARDAFNGALLWKRPLEGYGQTFFEDVAGQAVPNHIWRTPLSMNRRMVVQGGKVYVALSYRTGPLSVLDASTGKTLYDVALGGIVDEIVADGDLVVCRVRAEIPAPAVSADEKRKRSSPKNKPGLSAQEAREEVNHRITSGLIEQKRERVVAIDAAAGTVLWSRDAPTVAVQSLALAGGKVVFHNYQALITLDAQTGRIAWEYANPMKQQKFGPRNLLGNLLIADGRVLWTSSGTGGGVCLDLADGKERWTNARLGTTGGFAFPTARRVIGDVIYGDGGMGRQTVKLSDGSAATLPDVGDMLKRGHHIRCYPGKATQRYLITPQRGAEFIDLQGTGHMVNDWLRGACSLGNLPANGLFYVTPDPCSCYAGARIYGFCALAAQPPAEASKTPAPDDPRRLSRGPAFSRMANPQSPISSSDWTTYRHDARRTACASCALSAEVKPAWSRQMPGDITQATIARGRAYVVCKNTCEVFCLALADGKPLWRRAFPAALDGPPTVVGDRLFLGCRDGSVYCLHVIDGAKVWRFLAAPTELLTLSGEQWEGVWPVSSSVLFHQGLVYAVAGRSSYLDGGIHIYALDPATGAVKHHRLLEGPWPDPQLLRKAVVTENDLKDAEKDQATKEALRQKMTGQYATGYNLHGAEADLLVSDERGDLYLTQNKLTPALEPIPVRRLHGMGITPMGGMHVVANAGFLDDTMYHRSFRWYDESWPGYGTGSGWGARAGTMLAVGPQQAYAGKHYEGGWYPTHLPGSGNRLVADGFDHKNTSGALADKEILAKFKQFGNYADLVRTGAPRWEITIPVIVRTMLVAPAGQGGELVISAGIVEGTTADQWEKSTRYEGAGKLLIHRGADGKQLGEYDLPACPVFDGMAAAADRILISLVDGRVVCLDAAHE